eukprot:7803962-Pyramimonas_sp.AAC.1
MSALQCHGESSQVIPSIEYLSAPLAAQQKHGLAPDEWPGKPKRSQNSTQSPFSGAIAPQRGMNTSPKAFQAVFDRSENWPPCAPPSTPALTRYMFPHYSNSPPGFTNLVDQPDAHGRVHKTVGHG